MRAREPRKDVHIAARMRVDGAWTDVVIRNVSSRGMLLWSEDPPRTGDYIELCGPADTLVARAMWRRGNFFGIRTRERLDVKSALKGGRWRCVDPDGEERPAERRQPVAVAYDSSRNRAAAFQFGVVAAASLGGAGLLAILLYGLLAEPFQAIAANLGGG